MLPTEPKSWFQQQIPCVIKIQGRPLQLLCYYASFAFFLKKGIMLFIGSPEECKEYISSKENASPQQAT